MTDLQTNYLVNTFDSFFTMKKSLMKYLLNC